MGSREGGRDGRGLRWLEKRGRREDKRGGIEEKRREERETRREGGAKRGGSAAERTIRLAYRFACPLSALRSPHRHRLPALPLGSPFESASNGIV